MIYAVMCLYSYVVRVGMFAEVPTSFIYVGWNLLPRLTSGVGHNRDVPYAICVHRAVFNLWLVTKHGKFQLLQHESIHK